MNPFEPVVAKGKRAEEGRRYSHGMYGRTNIVRETRQRQSLRASPATDLFLGFADEDGFSGASKHNRGRQTVRP
jgi:hypothetical protein